jgi:hypothetical protein
MKSSQIAVFAACLLGLAGASMAQPVFSTTYVGEALVAKANVLGLVSLTLEDTGALPSGGGSRSTELLSGTVPGVLYAQLLSASTNGAANQTTSDASVANVTLSAAGVYVTASVLASNATASCQPGQASAAGNSTIAALTVNGISIKVTGQPNQTIPLIVGSLVINEQISSTNISGNLAAADIVVNALHLKVDFAADVVISSSHAGMKCGGIIPVAG